MKQFIKIIICLTLAISIPSQKAPAFTDKNSQTASTIIGLVAAGATTYFVFKKMRNNTTPPKTDISEKNETIDLSNDNVVIIDAKELEQTSGPQNSILKSLVVGVLCGALVGTITKVGSQWVMDRYLVDQLTAYVRNSSYKENPKEVLYPKNLKESEILEYLRKNNPEAHYFSTKSRTCMEGIRESYQEEQERKERERQQEAERKEQEKQERLEREERQRKQQEEYDRILKEAQEQQERQRKQQEEYARISKELEEQQERQRKQREEQEERKRKRDAERKEQDRLFKEQEAAFNRYWKQEREERERKRQEEQEQSYERWNQFFAGENESAPAAPESNISKEEALKNLEFNAGEKPTKEEINSRFKTLALKYHPDKQDGTPNKIEEAKKKFIIINEAKEKLTK